MKKELQRKLYKKFPKIFRQRKLSMKETSMCWGIDCGNGWYWLIDKLCDYIQRYIDNNNIPQIEAVQVKEKFGELRFYTGEIDVSASERINGAIWFATSISRHICENCGTTKEVTQNKKGWIRTLCKKCRKED